MCKEFIKTFFMINECLCKICAKTNKKSTVNKNILFGLEYFPVM